MKTLGLSTQVKGCWQVSVFIQSFGCNLRFRIHGVIENISKTIRALFLYGFVSVRDRTQVCAPHVHKVDLDFLVLESARTFEVHFHALVCSIEGMIRIRISYHMVRIILDVQFKTSPCIVNPVDSVISEREWFRQLYCFASAQENPVAFGLAFIMVCKKNVFFIFLYYCYIWLLFGKRCR